MRIDESVTHVCLDKGEVRVGDSVKLYRNVSVPRTKGPAVKRCQKKFQGVGGVTELLNEHYSVVRFEPGVDFKEGDLVER